MPLHDLERSPGGRRTRLTEIDGAVSARLGPARVKGNAQPAAFNRQIAMYLAKEVGGWSTTRIGRFYNGRDHSTVCYAIKRIAAMRQCDTNVDGLLNTLSDEILTGKSNQLREVSPPRNAEQVRTPECLIGEGFLDLLADRLVNKLMAKLSEGSSAARHVGATPNSEER